MGILDALYRLEALTSSYEPTASTSTTGPSPVQSPLPSASLRHSESKAHKTAVPLSFATAVVSKPSTDFIRAANSAQAAVYSISQTNSDKPGELEKAEVKRKIVGLATPLRKGVRGNGTGTELERPGRRPRKSKVGLYFNTENDPELPLRAALKLVDMYPEAVPPQLRTEILEKIETAQQHVNEMAELTKPKRQGKEDNTSESLRQLEEEIRQLEAEYATLRRETDDLMKAQTAQQFAEADESMASDASPLAQHTARQTARDAPKSHQGDLTARLLNLPADDGDVTTDFRNLVRADDSLLLEGDTPDISQLMAQTPMKLASSGKWDRPPSKQTEPIQAPEPAKPQHIPLASLRMRGASSRPAPPRTPPRREEDSFEETPRAGYTFEAADRDVSLDDVTSGRDANSAIFLTAHSPLNAGADETVDVRNNVSGDLEVDASVADEPQGGGEDEEPELDLQATRMKAFTIKLWSIAGDVLCPGHQYEVGMGSGTEPMPNFSKTKVLLKAIADEPGSPGATTEEIYRVLTAALLLHLVSRDSTTVESGEEFQAGMNETKELLAHALDARGWSKDHGVKVIFKWVGKKLLKSEGGRRLKCNLD